MTRFMFLLYGILCYSLFFLTFLYAVCFVTGVLDVPNALDGIQRSPLGEAILIDLALLALFAVQHSVMARPAFKKWWTKMVPEPIERSTYVLLASACLILLFWKWEPVGGMIWSVDSPVLSKVLTVLSLTGFLVVLSTTFLINHFDLFGLRQVANYFNRTNYKPLYFRTPFLYRYVRHPLYLGFIIAFWATPHMTIAHLVFAIMTTTYILLAIQFEERDLIRVFGVEYMRYKSKVPMLIPFSGSHQNPYSTPAAPLKTRSQTLVKEQTPETIES